MFSPRRNTHDIPDDILYEIFNNWLPKRDLLSCSTVSREWRTLAFARVFHSLSLLVRSGEYPDTSEIAINCYVQDLLQVPFFAKIHDVVRCLTLTWGRGNNIAFDFIDFIPLFHSLCHLTLQGRVTTRLPATYAHARGTLFLDGLAICGQLADLNDWCHAWDDPHHDVEALCDLLSLFGTLSSLTFRGLRHWDQEYLREDYITHWQDWLLPHPRTLTLDDFVPFLGFLEGSRLLDEVKHLDITSIGPHGRPVELAALCAATLEKLSLSLDREYHLQVSDGCVAHRYRPVRHDLLLFTHLRVLTLAIPKASYPSDFSECPYDSVDNATVTLRSLGPHVALDCVELRFWVGPGRSINSPRHERLAELKAHLASAGAHVRALEEALVALVQGRRVRQIRVGLYVAGLGVWLSLSALYAPSDFVPTIVPRLNFALTPAALCVSSDFVPTIFPRLAGLGMLCACE